MPPENFHEIQKLDLDTANLRHFRSVIDGWARYHPHHPYHDLGSSCDISAVYHVPCYIPVIDAQLEERQWQSYREPYRGQAVPGVLPDPESIWSLKVGTEAAYNNGTRTYIYGGPLERCDLCKGAGEIDCGTCGGHGNIRCRRCDGSGSVKCSDCHGTMQRRCGYCSGTGNVRESCYNYGCSGGRISYPGTCSACNGSGQIYGSFCGPCGGSGTVQTYRNCGQCSGGYTYSPCRNCNHGYVSCHCGNGLEKCGRCNNGRVTCAGCTGRGKVTCPDCKGCKQFIHYLVMTQHLEHRTDQSRVHSHLLDKYTTFRPAVDDSVTGRPVLQKQRTQTKQPLDIGSKKLEQAYDALFAKVKTSELRLHYHELKIYRIDCYIVKCSLDGTDFELAMYGKSDKIADYNSPVALLKTEHYQKGLELFMHYRFSESYTQLKLAAEMDKSENPMYAAALDRVYDHIILAYRAGIFVGLAVALLSMPLPLSIYSGLAGEAGGPVFILAGLLHFILLTGTSFAVLLYLVRKKGVSVKNGWRRWLAGLLFPLACCILLTLLLAASIRLIGG